MRLVMVSTDGLSKLCSVLCIWSHDVPSFKLPGRVHDHIGHIVRFHMIDVDEVVRWVNER